MADKLNGLWKLEINGQEWKLADEPSFTPLQEVEDLRTDSAGRVAGISTATVVPAMSFTVILTASQTVAALDAALKGSIVTAKSGNNGVAYAVYGARRNQPLSVSGSDVQVSVVGESSS